MINASLVAEKLLFFFVFLHEISISGLGPSHDRKSDFDRLLGHANAIDISKTACKVFL